MPTRNKRNYQSEKRDAQAAQTKDRILAAARELFQSNGFAHVTIEQLAHAAGVSAATIYALYQSKLGVLRALMEGAFPPDQFNALVNKSRQEESAKARLMISAKIARKINDAEKTQMDILRGASVLAPEFKTLEQEKEQLRYIYQEESVKRLMQEKTLIKGLSFTKARAILWAFTGRDMYRMFVVQQGWSSDEYEKWLGQLLIKTLLE